MVDFQSRDTKRGLGDDTDDDEPERGDGDEGSDEDTAVETEPAEEPERQTRTVTEDYDQDALAYAVVTVAADRSIDDDAAGDAVVDAIARTDDAVITRELLAPSYDGVQDSIDGLVGRKDVDAVVTVGGTGVEPADVTVDAVEDLLDKHLPGFGELFRALSHEHDGTAVVRTRTTAGIFDGTPVFCLPGDPTAARRGVEQIVLEEAGQLVAQARPREADGA